MKKIYTTIDPANQWDNFWSNRAVDEEFLACDRRNIAGIFLKHLPRDAPVLEAGCGLGAWVIYLSQKGYDIVGIDSHAGTIARLAEIRPSLNIRTGDIRQLPYEDGTFLAYISLGVMEHFEDGCEKAMAEARRVLKPGGLFFFTVPMENVFRKIIAHPLRNLYLRWRKSKGDEIHFAEFRYTPKEVNTLLMDNDFEPIFTDWDDFVPRDMSLGIWADFPQLHGRKLYQLNTFGRMGAIAMNSLSRWTASGGVFCLARKR
jgi:SAM-dependent methyltransferase